MVRIFMAICFFATTLALGAHASGFNLNDRVIVAYELTPQQESMFSATDNKGSAFWNGWETGPESLDYIYMSPLFDGGKHAWPNIATGFVNDSDAQVTIRLAYGANGLYMYWKVHDDQIVGVLPSSHYPFREDAIDFHFENHSSATINTGNYWIGTGSLTENCVQFQQLMGNAEGETFSWFVRCNWNGSQMDPISMLWIPDSLLSYLPNGTTLGIHVEIVAMTANDRVVEWHFPWSQIGNGGLPGKPTQGTQTGFECLYRDLDGSFHRLSNELVWNRANPYISDSCKSCWCDIEYGPPLGSVPVSVRMPAKEGIHAKSFGCSNSDGMLHYALPLPCFVSLQYFDLKGRQLASMVNQTQNAGYYNLSVPVANWAKGSYVQLFRAGTFVQKSVLVVVR